MRHRGRVDANQTDIVKAVRGVGWSAHVTSALGSGFPDVVVAGRPKRCLCYMGVNLLWEIKDGSLPPSRQVLTDDEIAFHRVWRGPVMVVRSVAEALAATGVVL